MDYDSNDIRHGDISVNMDCIMDDDLSHKELGMLIRLLVVNQPIYGEGEDRAEMLGISKTEYDKFMARLEELGYAYATHDIDENGNACRVKTTYFFSDRHEQGEHFEFWRQSALFILKQTNKWGRS
jgi:hypothetical protein